MLHFCKSSIKISRFFKTMTDSSWIEKLKSAKKAGLLQNGIFLIDIFFSYISNLFFRSKKSSLYIRWSIRNGRRIRCQNKFTLKYNPSNSNWISSILYLVRKWRQKPSSGLKTAATSDVWTFEIGQNYETRPIADNTLGMTESTTTVSVE